jgi:HlyD family secretion protein
MIKERGIKPSRWLVAGIILIILAILTGVVLSTRSSRQTTTAANTTVVVGRGPIVASTSGSGSIAASQSLDLPFSANGTVADVLVKEGAHVTKGQVLAQLDTRDLALQVANAHIQLENAKLHLTQSTEGNITQETKDAQEAQVRSAEAQLASAQAQLRSAQAQLSALRSPSANDIQAAEIAIHTAELDLQSVRDAKSVAKNRGQLDLDRAAQSLTQAQSSYSTALQNWQYVQDTGNDPINPTKASGTKTVANKLNDAQRQSYYDKLVQAESSMHNAETAVQQSQLAFNQAQQDEVISIQQAEAKLEDARRRLTALQNPSKNDITRQQASVDQAKASIAQAQAGLDQARANLAKLSAPDTTSNIELQQLSIATAEQSLQQAQLKLDQATLKAPFDSIVTTINIVPGSIVSSAQAAMSLIDRSTLHVDLTLNENDVAQVALGQHVDLTIDAIDDWKAQGTIDYIAPAAKEVNGVVTYGVRVALPDSDQRVKVGMTANLVIRTAAKDAVLLVPNSALLPKGAGRAVQVPNADGTTREVDVQIGLSDGTNTEIVSGLSEGDRVVSAPNSQQPRSPSLLP